MHSDDQSLSMGTLEIFDEEDDDDDDDDDDHHGNQIDATIAEAQYDVQHGRALLQELSGTNTAIRRRAIYLLGSCEPMGEEANPYKKRPADFSVEALDDAQYNEGVSIQALDDSQFQDKDGDFEKLDAPLN
jgi:hypothetical protein